MSGEHTTSNVASNGAHTGGVATPAAGSRPGDLEPCSEFLAAISHDFARRHLVLGVRDNHDRPLLLVAEHADPMAVFNAASWLGWPLETEAIDDAELAERIDAAYQHASQHDQSGSDELDESLDTAGDLAQAIEAADRDLLATGGKAPVVRLVDVLLVEALRRHASDLHVQPVDDRVLVRYRVDGVLHAARELKPALATAVVSRIKVLGGMDIAEKLVPQDGRSTVTLAGRSIDLRISTLPTSHGERAVVRLLDNRGGSSLEEFAQLGMPEAIEREFLARAGRSNGIVLVTGPTGSGKTTTLYTTLRHLAARGAGDLNVMTVEDPIEYELSTAGVAISQSQVNTKKGVTFARGLRHILRQDPDVVMVGEIRDTETARTAIQASLTGHLVFSTLHTNDAATAVTRLVDLGVEPYLVSASLSAVLAQRLVRRVHGDCHGRGCEACHASGFLGRIGLFELLAVDDTIRELVSRGGSASEIRASARARGMRSLHQEGRSLAERGVTTADEIARVTLGAADDDAPANEPMNEPTNGPLDESTIQTDTLP